MKKVIENTAYWVGILTLGIVVGVTIKMVGAWVEPGAMPPGGNIAAPLNTGNVGQAKQGGLTLNIGGAIYGLIVDKGLVGIGTTAPTEKLEVNGNIKLTGDTSGNPVYKITNVISPTNGSDVATKSYVDAAATGGGNEGNYYINRIPDISPQREDYSEICFKNGQEFIDKHNKGESTQGGNCVPGDMGFIIDQKHGPAIPHEEAKFDCAKYGMRLPEPDEWKYACKKRSEMNIKDFMTEWSSNLALGYLYGSYGVVDSAIMIFQNDSCSYGYQASLGDYWGREYKHSYRCVR